MFLNPRIINCTLNRQVTNIYVFVVCVSSNRDDILSYVDSTGSTSLVHDHIRTFYDAVTIHEHDIFCDTDHIQIILLNGYFQETRDYLKKENFCLLE